MNITEDAPIEVTTYRSSIDGTLVVEVDTEDDGVRLRVMVNDGMVLDTDTGVTDADPDYQGPAAILAQIAAEEQRTHKTTPDQIAASDAEFRAFVETLLREHPQYRKGA